MSLIYFLFLCLLSQAASLSFLSAPPKPPAKVLSETVLDEIFEVRYYEQDFQLNSKNFTHIKPMTFMGLNDLRTLNLTRKVFVSERESNQVFGQCCLVCQSEPQRIDWAWSE